MQHAAIWPQGLVREYVSCGAPNPALGYLGAEPFRVRTVRPPRRTATAVRGLKATAQQGDSHADGVEDAGVGAQLFDELEGQADDV